MEMTKRQRWVWGGIGIIALLFLILGTGARDRTDMISSVTVANNASTTKALRNAAQPASREHIVFGSIPYWDQDRAVADFKAHADAYDIISLFWYQLDDKGSIEKYRYAKEDTSLLSYARAKNVKTLALIANLPEQGDWDADRVNAAIGSEEARAAHIMAILALIETKGFDGVNIDYEMLDDDQTEDFSAFISELANALHAKNKILAVAIHAQYPGSPTRGQDLRALQAADILAIMTYDEHWETSRPGPVASLPWVREVLSHTLSLGVDAKKIYMGLPLYGYDWADGEAADGREYEDVVRIANREGSELRFDAFVASPVVTYTDSEGAERELWFENVESFRAKFNLVDEYGLGGVHLWRLGREDMRIYEVLQD